MREVIAEGTRFFYFTGAEWLADVALSGLSVTPPEPDLIAQLRGAADIRMVVFPNMLSRGRGTIHYLYWRNWQDLQELDHHVMSGSTTDDDFAASVKTSYQETWCDRCGSIWRTLVIAPGDPYPGCPGLLERKIAESRFAPCPACGASLRQMVVKILGTARHG